MMTGHRTLALLVVTGIGISAVCLGCRRSEESPQPKETDAVPKIPDTTERMTNSPAVEDAPRSVFPRTKPSTLPAPAVVAGHDAPLPGADAEPDLPEDARSDIPDALDAPPFLKPHRINAEWVKLDSVRTAKPGQLDRLLDSKQVDIVRPYQVKLVATCSYRHMKRLQQVVRVLTIETHLPEDAYGLFSVLATGSESKDKDLTLRTDSDGNRLSIHTWKERHYVRLVASGKEPPKVQDCLGVLREITFMMPDAKRPALVRAMPEEKDLAARFWFLRDLASLSGPGVQAIDVPKSVPLAEVLGLDRDAQMTIGAYRIPDARRPHLLWVVRYDRPEQAKAAHKRYEEYLTTTTDRWSQSTMLYPPFSQHLIGTWTAEEESLAMLMPKLRTALE